MAGIKEQTKVEIRVFGTLRTCLDASDLPYLLEREVGRVGESAHDIALGLGIPPEKVEAVFFNGKVKDIDDLVFPGDRIAYLPYGTPGPYRFFLGMVNVARDKLQRKRLKEKGNPPGQAGTNA